MLLHIFDVADYSRIVASFLPESETWVGGNIMIVTEVAYFDFVLCSPTFPSMVVSEEFIHFGII